MLTGTDFILGEPPKKVASASPPPKSPLNIFNFFMDLFWKPKVPHDVVSHCASDKLMRQVLPACEIEFEDHD